MIVTRYWLLDGMPRVESVEWQMASPLDTSVTITVPEGAEVTDAIAPTTPVQWVAISQPVFDAPAEQGVDFYALPVPGDAQIVTKAEWDEAVAGVEATRQEADRAQRVKDDERMANRKAAIEKLAKSAKLTTAQTEALVGGPLMAKVVPCTGDGIAVDDDGGVMAYGPRELAWKLLGTGSCNIDAHNGLKVDPKTHKMWVSPDTDVRWAQYGTKVESYVPKGTGSHAFTPIKLSLTTRDCMQTHARLRLSNGLTQWFLNSGDYWVQRLSIEAKINGHSTHSTSETVAFASTSATAYLGTGHPDFLMTRTLDPNTTIDITVRYFLDVLAFSTAGVNRNDLRMANVNLSYWSFPV